MNQNCLSLFVTESTAITDLRRPLPRGTLHAPFKSIAHARYNTGSRCISALSSANVRTSSYTHQYAHTVTPIRDLWPQTFHFINCSISISMMPTDEIDSNNLQSLP